MQYWHYYIFTIFIAGSAIHEMIQSRFWNGRAKEHASRNEPRLALEANGQTQYHITLFWIQFALAVLSYLAIDILIAIKELPQ